MIDEDLGIFQPSEVRESGDTGASFISDSGTAHAFPITALQTRQKPIQSHFTFAILNVLSYQLQSASVQVFAVRQNNQTGSSPTLPFLQMGNFSDGDCLVISNHSLQESLRKADQSYQPGSTTFDDAGINADEGLYKHCQLCSLLQPRHQPRHDLLISTWGCGYLIAQDHIAPGL